MIFSSYFQQNIYWAIFYVQLFGICKSTAMYFFLMFSYAKILYEIRILSYFALEYERKGNTDQLIIEYEMAIKLHFFNSRTLFISRGYDAHHHKLGHIILIIYICVTILNHLQTNAGYIYNCEIQLRTWPIKEIKGGRNYWLWEGACVWAFACMRLSKTRVQ